MSRLRFVASWITVACVVAAARVGAGEATIYRDSWGVPHIYADDLGDAAFAHGYAQAADRLEDLLGAYRIATGRAAGVYGPERLESDYIARVARHAELSRERYDELGEQTRRVVEQFVAGVRAYMAEHPERTPEWAEPPEPYQVVALYRAFAYAWPVGQMRGDLRRGGSGEPADRGSNQMVVGPRRSAEGAPIAIIDPHLSWNPESRFYEAHVHGGDLSFYGFSIIGTPIAALGHTDVFSLAFTTGGPDCADVYEERIHPEDPLRYEYEGEWRPITVEEIELEVITPSGLEAVKRRVERTHHGPILARRGNSAFAGRTAYDEEIALVEQLLAMLRARNLGQLLNALRMNQLLPQNLMYADVYGNTYYLRAGRVPVRPAGHHWGRPVPGWTSETEWRGVHRLSDLVQILNPAAGFMQNCNVSPQTMMPRSPLTADRYTPYLFNIEADRSNSRGRRALELLGGDNKVTVEQMIAVALDTYVEQAHRWQAALAAAYEPAGRREQFADLGPAVRLLIGWNRRTDTDVAGGALYRFWMRACRKDDSGVPIPRIESGSSLTDAQELALLESLRHAVEEMTRSVGRIDAPWGELHRARRGDRSWPVGGCNADGIGTLRSIRFSAPDERGISYAHGGQYATMVVLLEEGAVRSYSASPFGQSNDPDSPHYTDQGEQLFARGKLKPTWYSKQELLRHVESKQTLTVP